MHAGSASTPQFAQARDYALCRLSHELSPSLTYHSLKHTRDDVVPAVERLATRARVSDESLLLLRTAAYYHDIGFVEQYSDHEQAGVQIAASILLNFGYTPQQIATISGMILATRLPQSPKTVLEALLADADLDLLGREDFLPLNQALRAEIAAYGQPFADLEWYSNQLTFLHHHQYWTKAALSLRTRQKQHNITLMQQLLATSTDRSHQQ